MTRRIPLLTLLATLSFFRVGPVESAEVAVLLDVDPAVFRVRLDRVNFADPVTSPLVNEPVWTDLVLPGNVSGLRITLSMTVEPGIRIYDFRCPPAYSATSAIFVSAGAMPWTEGGAAAQVMSGALVWERGACTLVRSGLWDPVKGLSWSR